MYRIISHYNFRTKILWFKNWAEWQSCCFLLHPPPAPQTFPSPRTLFPQHLHIWTSKLYALRSTSYFFFSVKKFKLFHFNRWSVSLLVLAFYLQASFSQWFLPPSFVLFSCYITVFSFLTILLQKSTKKKKEKRRGKLSKCLSLYYKLWATVVHSRGTLGSYAVCSRDGNSLRGCSLATSQPPPSLRVEYWNASAWQVQQLQFSVQWTLRA